jgi:hypothetical protein
MRGAAIIYYSRCGDIYGNDRGEIATADLGNIIYYNIYSFEVFFSLTDPVWASSSLKKNQHLINELQFLTMYI